MATASGSSSSTEPKSLTRLYVGNLSQTVDEYSLMQICSKFGKISKLDYLFHKTGPLKGKPRGYAFVEYSTKEEAKRAIAGLHDRVIRGRKVTVTPASAQTQYAPEEYRSSALTGKGRGASRTSDAQRPSTTSLMKGRGVANASTDRKIAALEAKLASIREAKGGGGSRGASPAPTASGSGSGMSGEQWLDSLTPPTNEPNTNAAADGDDGRKEHEKSRKAIVDARLAHLPKRPAFDAPPPEPR